MFGIRTPTRRSYQGPETKTTPEKPPTPTLNVRESVGEWESGKTDAADRSPPKTASTMHGGTATLRRAQTLSQDSKLTTRATPMGDTSPPAQRSYVDKTSEARACLSKAKLHLNNSRNLKTDIKAVVVQAIERLYQLVKEAEAETKEKRKELDENNRKTPRSRAKLSQCEKSIATF